MALVTSRGSLVKPFADPRLSAKVKQFKMRMSKPDMIDGERLFNAGKADGWVWETATAHGMNTFEVGIAEGALPGTSQPRWGHTKEWSVYSFGLTSQFTREVSKFGAGYVDWVFKSLTNSYAAGMELLYASFYDSAIDGATVPSINGNRPFDTLTVDGQPFFSASHGYLGSNQTNSNLSSATQPMTASGMQAMTAQVRGWKYEDGLPMKKRIREVVYGDNHVGKFEVLTKTEEVTGSANNDLNEIRFMDFGGPVNKGFNWRLMGADDWMLRCSLDDSETGWFMRYVGKRKESIDFGSNEKIESESLIRTVGYFGMMQLGAEDWCEYITNRPSEA